MTYVFASPDVIAAAAGDLATIGSTIREANAAAAGSTTQIVAAAQDEVSAAISKLFGSHAQEYQALTAQTALFHDQFVQALSSGGLMHAATEAANVSPLQTLEQGILRVVNAPTEALFGRALIGNGTNGAPGTGQAGGPGGILIGNGGNEGSGTPGTGSGAGGTGGVGGASGLLWGHGGNGGAAERGSFRLNVADRLRPAITARSVNRSGATRNAARAEPKVTDPAPQSAQATPPSGNYQAPLATWLACTSSAGRASVTSFAQR